LHAVSVPHYSYALQVGSPQLTSIAHRLDTLCSMEDCIAVVDAKCSRSIQGDCVPSQFTKLYLMYSATDAACAAVDFAKGNVEDGIMNNPPSHGVGMFTVPIAGVWLDPYRVVFMLANIADCMYSSEVVVFEGCSMQHRGVYYDNEVCVQPATKLLKLQSHGSGRHQLSEKRGRFLRT
jgi:hypothetical protein